MTHIAKIVRAFDLGRVRRDRRPRCCGRAMVVRTKRTDRTVFYGCARYPKCRATRPIDQYAYYAGTLA